MAYTDNYHGWPVSPVHKQPPIRSVFLDPRPLVEIDDPEPNWNGGPTPKPTVTVKGGVYHLGVDVSVNDQKPEKGATGDHTHRVYAIEGGVVQLPTFKPGTSCGSRVVRVGTPGISVFGYGHTDAVGTVTNGEVVKAGQMIGWTCRGHWHVHITEFAWLNGTMVEINPLRPNGKLGPYYNASPPEVGTVGFYPPENPDWHTVNHVLVSESRVAPLDPMNLSGLVDLRAEINDPQSNAGWEVGKYARLQTYVSPYSVQVVITKGGSPVLSYQTFRGDTYLATDVPGYSPAVDFSDHYAPGTKQALPANECMAKKYAALNCNADYWFRIFAGYGQSSPYWDTTTMPNGTYTVKVSAFDMSGNEGTANLKIRINNPG